MSESKDDSAASRLFENEQVLVLLREINHSLTLQNERLARIEAFNYQKRDIKSTVIGESHGEPRLNQERQHDVEQREANTTGKANETGMHGLQDISTPGTVKSDKNGENSVQLYKDLVEQDLRDSGILFALRVAMGTS